MNWKSLFAVACAILGLTGCAVHTHITEATFIRPTPGGELPSELLTRLPAGYTAAADWVPAADGAALYRVRFTHPQARATVLFFGGNVSTISKTAEQVLRAFTQEGWTPDLVLVDYRGYGRSTGKAKLESILEDALLVYDREAGESRRPVIVAGYSMGGMLAGYVVEKRRPAGSILIATTTTVSELVEEAWPLTRALGDVKISPEVAALDNGRAVRGYDGPLLLVAGGADTSVPPVLARRLYERARSSGKNLLVIDGASHNDLFSNRQLWVALAGFGSRF